MRYMLWPLVFTIGCSSPSSNNSAADVGDGSADAAVLRPDVASVQDMGSGGSDANVQDTGEPNADAAGPGDDVGAPDTGTDGVIFADEFDGSRDFLADSGVWSVLHSDRADTLMTEGGRLLATPSATSSNHWFSDSQGPFVFRNVTGDFVFETVVGISQLANETQPPPPGYNSAGFVVRDPASVAGSENWVMYNIGAQSAQVPYGLEAKTTVDSSSTLELFDVSSNPLAYRLRVCRIGAALRYFFAPASGGEWTETLPQASHERADFPAELQIGLVAGTWDGSAVRAWYEYAVAWRPTAGCTGDAP